MSALVRETAQFRNTSFPYQPRSHGPFANPARPRNKQDGIHSPGMSPQDGSRDQGTLLAGRLVCSPAQFPGSLDKARPRDGGTAARVPGEVILKDPRSDTSQPFPQMCRGARGKSPTANAGTRAGPRTRPPCCHSPGRLSSHDEGQRGTGEWAGQAGAMAGMAVVRQPHSHRPSSNTTGLHSWPRKYLAGGTSCPRSGSTGQTGNGASRAVRTRIHAADGRGVERPLDPSRWLGRPPAPGNSQSITFLNHKTQGKGRTYLPVQCVRPHGHDTYEAFGKS